MPIVKKAPGIMTREVKLEEPVNQFLEDYSRFIESSADHVINAVLKKVLWRDPDYRKWRDDRRRLGDAPTKLNTQATSRERHDAENLESRAFLAASSRWPAGAFLFYTHPFPRRANPSCMSLPSACSQAFSSFKYIYYVLLFTSPYMVCSTALSGLYIFTLKPRQKRLAGPSSPIPDPSKRVRSVSRRRRSAQPTQAVSRKRSLLAHDPRTRIVYGNRHLGRDRERQDFLLHALRLRTNSGLQSRRQRKEDRRN